MLQAAGLAVFRGEKLVFRDLNFTVAPGQVLLLTGPNGSGKSTLLRVLAGLLRPEAGSLSWNGEDVLADVTAHARRIAYLGHQDAVKPALTVEENLRFTARLFGGDARTALQAVGLQTLTDLPARMLSAGQRRRLALARLALSPTPIWLLDEPTVGLDATSIELFGAMLAKHSGRSGMTVAATHQPLPAGNAQHLALVPDAPGETAQPL